MMILAKLLTPTMPYILLVANNLFLLLADVNECALNNSHMCEYKCKNFGGYHQCICPDGSIQGNGKRCPQGT